MNPLVIFHWSIIYLVCGLGEVESLGVWAKGLSPSGVEVCSYKT